MSAKCPKCEAELTAVRCESVIVMHGIARGHAVAYCCEKCGAAIGVALANVPTWLPDFGAISEHKPA